MDNYIIHHQIGVDDYYKTWHKSGDNMVIYIHSEGGTLVCDEKVYPLKPGVLCFIGSQRFHYTMPDDPQKYDRSKIFVSDENLKKMSFLFPNETNFDQVFTSGSLVYAQIDNKEKIIAERIFDEIGHNENDPKYFDTLLLTGFARLLMIISKNAIESVSTSKGFISRAVEYINTNIFSELSIDAICAAIHTSKYHFCRQFKKATGLTVSNYILKTRIVMAEGMLQNSDATVGEVSEKCGFCSISYFCRVFKDETGMTPRQYKLSHGA